MSTYIATIVFASLITLGIVGLIARLGVGDFPFQVTWTRGEAAGVLVVRFLILIWLILILVDA